MDRLTRVEHNVCCFSPRKQKQIEKYEYMTLENTSMTYLRRVRELVQTNVRSEKHRFIYIYIYHARGIQNWLHVDENITRNFARLVCDHGWRCMFPSLSSSLGDFGKKTVLFGRVCTAVSMNACFFFFKSSGGWVKIKLKLPHFHVSDTYKYRVSI